MDVFGQTRERLDKGYRRARSFPILSGTGSSAIDFHSGVSHAKFLDSDQCGPGSGRLRRSAGRRSPGSSGRRLAKLRFRWQPLRLRSLHPHDQLRLVHQRRPYLRLRQQKLHLRLMPRRLRLLGVGDVDLRRRDADRLRRNQVFQRPLDVTEGAPAASYERVSHIRARVPVVRLGGSWHGVIATDGSPARTCRLVVLAVGVGSVSRWRGCRSGCDDQVVPSTGAARVPEADGRTGGSKRRRRGGRTRDARSASWIDPTGPGRKRHPWSGA